VIKSQSLRADFARAVTRLDEAPALPKDPIVWDSAVRDFVELCWKFLKAYLEERHNALCTLTPDLRSVLDRSDGFAEIIPFIPITSSLPITYIRS
jgi:hypothetical protein